MLPSFVSAGTFETRGSHPINLVAGDVNADGNLDLVVDSWSMAWGEVGWIIENEYRDVLLARGPGEWDGWLWDWSGGWTGGGQEPDFNRDGITDRFSVNLGTGYPSDPVYYGSTVTVQLGDGAGGFGAPQQVWGGPISGRNPAVTGDFNQDGYSDLAVAHSENFYGGITILRNDGSWPPLPPPVAAVRIDDATISEGHTGTRAMNFTVSLPIASSQPVTVDYATANGTAAGADYLSTAGTLTFAPGETMKTVTVPVLGDRLGEPNETFVVNLTNPTNAYIADGQGLATIVDDEPRISINDVAKLEGKKGKTTLFVFTVTLSASYDQPVTMSFATIDGSARTSNNDYVARTGTLTFAPGETTKTITIEVKGDSKRESDEYFYLDLFGLSSNALFGKSRGIGTILNDD